MTELTTRATPAVSTAAPDPEEQPLLLRSGEATLFLTTAGDGAGRRVPVVTIEGPGLLAVEAAPPGYRWVLGPGLGCAIEEITFESDGALVSLAAAATVQALGGLLQQAAAVPPERVVHLGEHPSQVADGQGATVETTAWVEAVRGAATLAEVFLPARGAPLSPRLAVLGARGASIAARPLAQVPVSALLVGIAWLFTVSAQQVLGRHAELGRRDADLARASDERAQEAELSAVELLAQELRSRSEPVIPRGADPLVASATRVLATKNLELKAPRRGLNGLEGTAAVRELAATSKVYARRVILNGAWWKAADEAVVGFHPDGSPVALVPASDGMQCIQADGRREAVDERVASGLLDAGFVFSKPLLDAEVDERTVARTAVAGRRRPIVSYVGWATMLAISGLAVPFASGVVFKEIVPAADRTRLWYLLIALVLVALATLPLQLALTSSKTRFETSASLDVQRGIWGRVLSSPVTLARRIGAGDLAMRLSGLENARDQIDTTVLSVLPALLSGLLAGLVLFIYDAALTALVLLGGLFILAVGLLLARAAARAQEELDEATGAVNGFLFQVLIAIPKLRVAGAEARAFLSWADHFRFAVGQSLMRASARQILLTAMIPTLGTLVLFTGVAIVGPAAISVGVFLAFQTTYNLFLTGVGSTVTAAGTVQALRPTLERAVELTSEPPEWDPDRAEQGRLTGAVAFAGVTFRYQPTMRPVLDEISFKIEPSEMVAIAGHSGSGKSTIIRLLVGFEEPEQGSVLYDGQHLSSLDLEAVRRQLGVVLQEGHLIPGTVRENLAGVASLTEQDAWELAEVVALADEIREMPMGMDTMITLNGGAFSGGQRQRLLIARALAGRPRILLLDEATSSLDNVSQRVITENLAQLGMTRIVVAHRLSTMIDADRILVIDRGRVVEEGPYDELMSREGHFHRLAARQIL
jgi:NHLM bacteriocin system ABC transporter ATP-binding protein